MARELENAGGRARERGRPVGVTRSKLRYAIERFGIRDSRDDRESGSGGRVTLAGREDGGRWPRVAVVAACAAVVAVTAVTSLQDPLTRLGRAHPGFLARAGGVVTVGPRRLVGDALATPLAVQVLAIEGDGLLDDAAAMRSYVARLSPGTPVTYRVRRGDTLARVTLPASRFDATWLLASAVLPVMVAFAALCSALAVALRAPPRSQSGAAAVSLLVWIALAAVTLPDALGSGYFLPLHHLAVGLTCAAWFYVALSVPDPVEAGRERRLIVLGLHLTGALFGLALQAAAPEPSLFVPLWKTVEMVILDGVLLVAVRVVTDWLRTVDSQRKRALAGLAGALAGAGGVTLLRMLLVREGHWLAAWLILLGGVVVLLPAGAAALLRLERTPRARAANSIRDRLSLLFLSSAQTGIFVALSLYWLNGNWIWLVHDMRLARQQREAFERLVQAIPAEPPDIEAARLAATSRAAHEAVEAIASPPAGLRDSELVVSAGRLLGAVRRREAELRRRLEWLTAIGGWLVACTVLVAVLQASLFLVALRRWFARPIERLAEGSRVIATGNLDHRVPCEPEGGELDALGRDINRMAESLAAIQRRFIEEREARQTAAAAARDAERRRLARELHDGALQDLGAIKLLLEGQMGRQPGHPLRPVVTALTRVIAGVRRVVDDLRGPDMETGSLPEAIATHAEILGRGRGVEVHVQSSPEAEVPPWATRDLYRIAQEAIANAVRHAAPRNLYVRLARDGSAISLEVEDDGAGFDPETVVPGGGLLGIRERATALGGEIRIRSRPGQGTLVRVTVPVR